MTGFGAGDTSSVRLLAGGRPLVGRLGLGAAHFPSSDKVRFFPSRSILSCASSGTATACCSDPETPAPAVAGCGTHPNSSYHSTKKCGSGILSMCNALMEIAGGDPVRHPPIFASRLRWQPTWLHGLCLYTRSTSGALAMTICASVTRARSGATMSESAGPAGWFTCC